MADLGMLGLQKLWMMHESKFAMKKQETLTSIIILGC